jgi:hypothetical protein
MRDGGRNRGVRPANGDNISCYLLVAICRHRSGAKLFLVGERLQ